MRKLISRILNYQPPLPVRLAVELIALFFLFYAIPFLIFGLAQ